MKTLKEKIEVMQAALDGEKIEQQHFTEDRWVNVAGNISWNWNAMDYRIKPKPLEFWVNVYDDGEKRYFNNKDESTLDVGGRKGFVKTVKACEVTE